MDLQYTDNPFIAINPFTPSQINTDASKFWIYSWYITIAKHHLLKELKLSSNLKFPHIIWCIIFNCGQLDWIHHTIRLICWYQSFSSMSEKRFLWMDDWAVSWRWSACEEQKPWPQRQVQLSEVIQMTMADTLGSWFTSSSSLFNGILIWFW